MAISGILLYNLRAVRSCAMRGDIMPKYVIERDISNIGDATPDQVIAISQKSCGVLQNLGPKIQWLHSYVTQDKIYLLRLHRAQRVDGARTRAPGRLPRQPHFRSEAGD